MVKLVIACLLTLTINLCGMEKRASTHRPGLRIFTRLFGIHSNLHELAQTPTPTEQQAGSANQQPSPVESLTPRANPSQEYVESFGRLHDVQIGRKIEPCYIIKPTTIPGKRNRASEQYERDERQYSLNTQARQRLVHYTGLQPIRIWTPGVPAPQRTENALYEYVARHLRLTAPRALGDAITMEYILNRLMRYDHRFPDVAKRILDLVNDVENNFPGSVSFALMLLAVRRGYSFVKLQEEDSLVKSELPVLAEKIIFYCNHHVAWIDADDPDKVEKERLQHRLRNHILKDTL